MKTKKKAKKKAAKTSIKKGPGRKPFKPTADQRLQVKTLVGLGLTYIEIASVTINPKTKKGIALDTLQKHFREELDSGMGYVKSRVASSLVRKALNDDHPQSAICAMF